LSVTLAGVASLNSLGRGGSWVEAAAEGLGRKGNETANDSQQAAAPYRLLFAEISTIRPSTGLLTPRQCTFHR